MKRIIPLFVLMLVCSLTTLQAQHDPMNKQQFRERQKQFIIQRVKLTQEEAEKFFPLYFELQDKKHELNRNVWKQMRNGQKGELTDTEYDKIVEDVIKARIAADKLDLEYVKKYKKFLSPKKVYRLMRSEMTFHRNLLNSFTHNKKGKRAQRPVN